MRLVDVLGLNEDDAADFGIYELNGYDDKIKILVDEEIKSYDEGNVTSRYVIQEIATGKFYEFTYWENSWSESSDDATDIELTEVAPVQVMVTQYKPVS